MYRSFSFHDLDISEGRHVIPDLYDPADDVAEWELRNLHDLALFPGLDLHFKDSAQHLTTAD